MLVQGEPLAVICPMSYHGVGVGALGLASPAGASVHRALSAVAEPVAAALHAATLTEAVRHSRIELISAVEEERRRLRRDLHDGLGPSLATFAMGLDAVANQVAGTPAGTEVDRTLTRLREQADQMLTDLR
jgi:signal transduction histidine kinase